MKSIYEIQIPVKDQPQADRLKAICLEYGLPIWEDDCAFNFDDEFDVFAYSEGKFFIHAKKEDVPDSVETTEEEFINLLKEMKNGKENN